MRVVIDTIARGVSVPHEDSWLFALDIVLRVPVLATVSAGLIFLFFKASDIPTSLEIIRNQRPAHQNKETETCHNVIPPGKIYSQKLIADHPHHTYE